MLSLFFTRRCLFCGAVLLFDPACTRAVVVMGLWWATTTHATAEGEGRPGRRDEQLFRLRRHQRLVAVLPRVRRERREKTKRGRLAHATDWFAFILRFRALVFRRETERMRLFCAQHCCFGSCPCRCLRLRCPPWLANCS